MGRNEAVTETGIGTELKRTKTGNGAGTGIDLGIGGGTREGTATGREWDKGRKSKIVRMQHSTQKEGKENAIYGRL